VSGPNPYKILQVDPEAEPEVVEAAYRRLARKYHPDVSTGPDAQQRMVLINQAWEMLRDPMRRAAVDRARARASDSAARVAAADAHVHVRAYPGASAPAGGHGQGRAAEAQPGSGGVGAAASGRRRSWPIQGMQDTGGQFGDRGDPVSPDLSAGRSAAGGGYDPRTMGTAQGAGSAGPPPGNPSGSVLSFGRYSGWSLSEVARTDLEYLEWLDRMPIGRIYQFEIDGLLRSHGRRATAPTQARRRGLFRRR
jgi:curved DNA-binding protein CbpA